MEDGLNWKRNGRARLRVDWHGCGVRKVGWIAGMVVDVRKVGWIAGMVVD